MSRIGQLLNNELAEGAYLYKRDISNNIAPYSRPTTTKGNQTLIFFVDVPSSGLSAQTCNNTWSMTVADLS